MSFVLCHAQDESENILLRANEAMAGENFVEAISQYELLHKDQYTSFGLYFNLGAAYYHEGQIAKSILNLERALKLSPRNKDLLKALALAKDKIDDGVIPAEPFFITSALSEVRDLISAGTWALVALFFLWALTILIYGEIKEKNWMPPRYRLFILSTMGLVLVGSLLFAIARYQFEKDTSLAIMMASDAGLYLAPDTSSDLLQRVEAGEKVRIMKKLGEWVEIELENRDRGWSMMSSVETI